MPATAHPRPRAVVIDDDVLVATFVKTVLSAIGFDVATAESGEAGLALVLDLQPTLAIIDMRMPGLSGPEVIEAIGRAPIAFPTIVGMSAAWEETEQQAIALGAAAFLRKPLSAQILVSTVEGALGRRFVWIDDN